MLGQYVVSALVLIMLFGYVAYVSLRSRRKPKP